ncbi:MAG TPA: FABP family protein [Acidimicrobiales bacterium]|nr:FABP family protein [Acidimicrobiales bacterium]
MRYQYGVHPDVEPIAFLIGTWRGEGHGVYPTITAFDYGEEVRFAAVPGKPFLTYSQRTWALDDRRPLHAETGYWRPKPGGRLEVVLAHPTGISEIEEGTLDGTAIDLTATSIGLAATAKEVTGVTRRFELSGPGLLRYEVQLAAVGQPLQGHLTAELRRVDEG